MLSRSCTASTFSWWWSLSSCFCANLWILLDTQSTSRSLWRSLFLMYQGALTMLLSTLFWNHRIMSILLCLVQPQSWIPYVQTGFSICLYRSSLLWRDSEEFLPISQYIFLYPRPSSFRFFLTWAWSCRWNKKALSPEDLQMICHAIYNIKIDQNNFLHTTFLIHRAHPLSYPNYTAYWKQKMLQWARKQKCWIRPRSCQMWYRISR